ncbi:Zn(II)2Cys6 transcription factor domain-containing protein [Aspergillus ibericus CBS 121593]|uniref:C6 finger domain protein n=1 Tax=Aspergillus ibericus CBS 121593 TaxID=1448316 RepID=A0A395GJ84_9EURO|nr:C6 finger domain protein [Aspergillus ibericus CBS 121593]RAK95541.1 C6 finger domain protein [Aspergillus ibericus CBS 121593]
MPSTGPRDGREGKVRRRSRFGCRNCKLRKLKCDESKPQCKRCRSFGLLCPFMSNIPDLQPVAADRQLVVQSPPSNAVWTSDESTCYHLDARCQEFISRYLGRSLIPPDNPNMIQVNRKLLELAFTYPFLMHASLAVALTYDRHLKRSGCRRTLEECYHWSQATVLLNNRLSGPIQTEDKDPIWGTAAALVILTFSSDAYTAEQAWPLTSSDSDLDWLRLSKSKMLLWHIVNPLRPDSLFHVLAATFAEMQSPLPQRGIDGMPQALAAMCNLNDTSTAETNPYFRAAHAVSQILNRPKITIGQSQIFMDSIHGPFEDLLREKDPAALLLLYLWYCRASRSIWFIELRARVECPSICSYLRRYHSENGAVQAFLPKGDLAQVPS